MNDDKQALPPIPTEIPPQHLLRSMPGSSSYCACANCVRLRQQGGRFALGSAVILWTSRGVLVALFALSLAYQSPTWGAAAVIAAVMYSLGGVRTFFNLLVLRPGFIRLLDQAALVFQLDHHRDILEGALAPPENKLVIHAQQFGVDLGELRKAHRFLEIVAAHAEAGEPVPYEVRDACIRAGLTHKTFVYHDDDPIPAGDVDIVNPFSQVVPQVELVEVPLSDVEAANQVLRVHFGPTHPFVRMSEQSLAIQRALGRETMRAFVPELPVPGVEELLGVEEPFDA